MPVKVDGKHSSPAADRMCSYLIFGAIYPLSFVTEVLRRILSIKRPYEDCPTVERRSVFVLAKDQTLAMVSYALEARAILQRSSR